MVAMTGSPYVGRTSARTRAKPVTALLNLLILALRPVMPYTLVLVGFSCLVFAGFLYNVIAGLAVLGICFLLFQYLLENQRGD